MRAVIILLCIAALLLVSLACRLDPVEPDPTGWSAQDAIGATETHGVKEWHIELTRIAQETPPP